MQLKSRLISWRVSTKGPARSIAPQPVHEGRARKAKPAFVKSGTWCPACSGRQKLTLEMLQDEAVERGGRLLTTEYADAHSPLRWECAEGHQWDAAASKVRYGTWCPYCARKARLNIEEMRELARSYGGECDRQLPVFDCANWAPRTARFLAVGPNSVRCCVPAMALRAAPFDRRIVVDVNWRQALSTAGIRQFVHVIQAVSRRFGAFGTPGAAFLISGRLHHTWSGLPNVAFRASPFQRGRQIDISFR